MPRHSGGYPFKRDKTGAVYDSSGEQIRLLGATRQILTELATDPKCRWMGAKGSGGRLGGRGGKGAQPL